MRICTSPPARFLFPSSQTRQPHSPVCFWGLGYFRGLGWMEIVVCVCGWRRLSLRMGPRSLMVSAPGCPPSVAAGWCFTACLTACCVSSVCDAHLRAAPLGLGNVLPEQGCRCPLRPCSPLWVCTSCHTTGSAFHFLRSPSPPPAPAVSHSGRTIRSTRLPPTQEFQFSTSSPTPVFSVLFFLNSQSS